MNTICRFIDNLFLLNRFYDVNNKLLKESDHVTLNYGTHGIIDRHGTTLVVNVGDNTYFDLDIALKSFRIEKV